MSIVKWVNNYFNLIADPMFQRDEQGREVVFPMGMFSRGRIVPDAVTSASVRRKLRGGWMVFMFGWIPVLVIATMNRPTPWLYVGALVVSIILSFAIGLYAARGLSPTGRRMTFRNQAQEIQATYSMKRMVLLAAMGLILTALCVVDVAVPGVAAGQPYWVVWICWFGIVLFGASTLMWFGHVITKWRRG